LTDCADPPEIDRGEIILQIEVEDVAPALMQCGIGDDGALPDKTVCERPALRCRLKEIIEAIVEQIR